MTRPTPIELTDAFLDMRVSELAGSGAPTDLVREIVDVIGATPQQRPNALPRLGWPGSTQRRSTWMFAGALLLVGLTIGAALVGSALMRRPAALAGGPLIVYQVRGAYADVYTLDVTTGEQTPLGSVQLTAELGGQRIRWANDGRHAFVFGDPDRLQAEVDLAAHAIIPVLMPSDAQRDEVSPSGDRIARLSGDATNGMSLSIVGLDGTQLVHIDLPDGTAVTSDIEWAPDGSSILLTGCLPCDLKNAASPTDHEHLFLVPLDGGPMRTLTDSTGDTFGGPQFSPDGSTIAYSTTLCRDTCSGGIASLRIADGRVAQLTTGGADGAPAWSPDGHRIAFQHGSTDPGIYVIDAGGGPATRLTTAGSGENDGDRGPVWSPDAAWIAFTRNVTDTSLGDLMLVPSVGGTPRLVASNAAADWGPSAALVPVVPIAVASPTPTPSPEPISPPSEGASPSTPRASGAPAPGTPTGGSRLMVWQLDGSGPAEAKTESVYTVDVGTGQRTDLGTIPVNEDTCCPEAVQWSADRQRAFLSVEYLRAIADLRTGALTPVGPPPAGQWKESISPRGDRRARVDEVTGATQTIVISDLAGKELARLKVPFRRAVTELAWSPDERALAATGCGPCLGDGPPDVEHVAVIPLDGSTPREVADDTTEVKTDPPTPTGFWEERTLASPAWSPDGRTIVVTDTLCRHKDSRPSSYVCSGHLVLIDAVSGQRTALPTGDGMPESPRWSPDGTRLAYGLAAINISRWTSGPGASPSPTTSTQGSLFVMDRDGGHIVRLANGGTNPDWSPDGTWIAYWHITPMKINDGLDHVEVWVVPADGGTPRQIAEHAAAGW